MPSNRFESVDVLQETTATSPGNATTSPPNNMQAMFREAAGALQVKAVRSKARRQPRR